jgi:hypothetical protein
MLRSPCTPYRTTCSREQRDTFDDTKLNTGPQRAKRRLPACPASPTVAAKRLALRLFKVEASTVDRSHARGSTWLGFGRSWKDDRPVDPAPASGAGMTSAIAAAAHSPSGEFFFGTIVTSTISTSFRLLVRATIFPVASTIAARSSSA